MTLYEVETYDTPEFCLVNRHHVSKIEAKDDDDALEKARNLAESSGRYLYQVSTRNACKILQCVWNISTGFTRGV